MGDQVLHVGFMLQNHLSPYLIITGSLLNNYFSHSNTDPITITLYSTNLRLTFVLTLLICHLMNEGPKTHRTLLQPSITFRGIL